MFSPIDEMFSSDTNINDIAEVIDEFAFQPDLLALNEEVEAQSDDDSEYWTELFSNIPPHQIGVIKSSGKLISNKNLEQLCTEIRTLTNHGLFLPLVIGGGVQYDQLPSYADSFKVNGLRVTSDVLIKELVPIAIKNQYLTVQMLRKFGVDAVAIPFEHISVKPHGTEYDINRGLVDMGFVGDVTKIWITYIKSAIENGKVPVLSHIGMFKNEFYNVNATDMARELILALEAKKLIILGETPILNKNGKIIKTIISRDEFNGFVQDGTIQGGMIVNGRNGFDTLDYLGSDCSVQITALVENGSIVSTGILEELLGKGSGTKLTIPSEVSSFTLDMIDYKILKYMMNNSFNIYKQSLVDNYFEIIAPRKPNVYIDEKERGGAITYHIKSPQVNFEYICKLFKQPGYDGLGIGTSLIYHIQREEDRLAWRCDKSKLKELKFYDKIITHYNGIRVDSKKYVIFGIGIEKENEDEVFKIINSIEGTLKKE